MIKYVVGDLVRDAKNFEVIVQGCNCFCTMGSGIALQIRKAFPEAFEADKTTIRGDKTKLGTITYYRNEKHPIVVNAYTQYYFGEKDTNADYEAIRQCMKRIKLQFKGKKIGMPRIGAGLARGDWNIIEDIINEELDCEDVTVVVWNKDPLSKIIINEN